MNSTGLRVVLWVLTGVLCVFGGIVVISRTAGNGAEELTNYWYLIRQMGACAIGLIGAMLISYLGTEVFRKTWVVVALAIAVAVSLLYAQFGGLEINGARRWISLGIVNFQPAEFAKLGLIFILAWQLNAGAEKIRLHWQGVLFPALIFCVFAGLVYMTRDLGSVLVMAAIFAIMLYFADGKWLCMIGAGLSVLPLFFYYSIFDTFYRYQRIQAFLNPWDDSNATAFHLQQSLIAIGTGGTTGVGLAQASTFLPEDHTDFVFARICQEFGMYGALTLATTFLFFVIIGMAIASTTHGRHQRLLAVGATMFIGLQAFWNMMVALGSVPTKGLTLPFISYGGTSMVMCMLAVGILDAVIRKPIHKEANTSLSTARIGAITTRTIRKKDKRSKRGLTAGSL